MVLCLLTALPAVGQLARQEKATMSLEAGRTSYAAGSEAEIHEQFQGRGGPVNAAPAGVGRP